MPNPYFRFKQFTVFHDKCAMKVGADGVTLGAWTDVSGAKTALDVGCGSGLIALMIAQRCNARITAIDIDEQSVIQTIENVERSPWQHRIEVVHASFQEFAKSVSQPFDLIVSNPPYFVNSLKTPSQSRTTARHTDTLPYSDLISNAQKLLTEKGKLCVILPVREGNQFTALAEEKGLFCTKKVTVFPNYEKPAKRLLLEFRKEKGNCEESELTIEKTRNVYTEEYAGMIKGFYLKIAP